MAAYYSDSNRRKQERLKILLGVSAPQDGRTQGKRTYTSLDEALPASRNQRFAGGAGAGRIEGDGNAANMTEGAGVGGLEMGRLRGVEAWQSDVKIEQYDGSYECLLCSESVRGDTAVLQCWQCSSNPFH